MYTPKNFCFDDRHEIVAFMKRYSFATIVTNKGDIPIATQLPFFIDDNSSALLLRSHFAVANEQAKYIEQHTSLIVFSEPHAYISPTHYDKKESVPTWDYIAVHAYGKAKIAEDENAKREALEQTITFYEQSYLEQWNSLPDKFKSKMMKGIVAFEIEVQEIQAQKKLSQNKTDAERRRIAEHLQNSSQSVEKDIATYIQNLK